ncbi:hypothetical protein DFQ26_005493 [Actinomortierella ambigua]|nr:hypothetical protein DFQ26_005493 [Actinomortierella ambigua]
MDAKRDFLEASALGETLERLRFAPNTSLSPLQQQIRDITDNILTRVEVSELMSSTEGNEVSFIGEGHIQKQLESLEKLRTPLIATVEDALRTRAGEIALVHSTISSSPDPLSKPLPNIVRDMETQLEFLELRRTMAIVDKIHHNQTLTSLFSTLYKTVDTLWEMIQLFKIKHQLEKDQALQHYFDAVVHSTLLKLQVLEGHLAEDIYDPKTTESLMNARHLLSQRHDLLQRELAEKDVLLHKYQSVGKDFGQIVAAYEEVKKHIEIVQEDIQHLQQT